MPTDWGKTWKNTSTAIRSFFHVHFLSNAILEGCFADQLAFCEDLSRVVFTIKTRTEEEAATTVSDLDAP